MIVSENNGRSIAADSTYLVTPDELIYNFQTYAGMIFESKKSFSNQNLILNLEITKITPNSGSTEGFTTIQIIGKYLFHSNLIPAKITVAGSDFFVIIKYKKEFFFFILLDSQCNVIGFNNADEENSIITCQTQPIQPSKTNYYGNRGLLVTINPVYTPFLALGVATPPPNAQTIWVDAASYQYTSSQYATIWLTGYLAPSTSSDYLFSIDSNSPTKFYLSTDSTSANKVYGP